MSGGLCGAGVCPGDVGSGLCAAIVKALAIHDLRAFGLATGREGMNDEALWARGGHVEGPELH